MPWAIEESKLLAILEVIDARAAGFKFDTETIAARIEEAGGQKQPVNRSSGLTAVIPIVGVIQHRMDMLSEMSGGTSTQAIGKALDMALADDRIRSIVLEIDSPGGSVAGVAELADKIFAARGQKPITAIANTMAASAAYHLGSQADEFVVTPSGAVGSIGVFGVHQDVSQHLEAEGVKTTIVSAGKYKVEGNQFEPLSGDARDNMQAQVDAFYGMFVSAVARGRGVSEAAVRGGFGEGRMVLAKDAVSAGMVDRVATIDQVLSRHGGTDNAAPMARSEDPAERQRRLARSYDMALSHRNSARPGANN
jgi:signal peptide peptidase SppA